MVKILCMAIHDMQMHYDWAKRWLFSRKIKMKGYNLENITKLIKEAGIPIEKIKAVHVAGSNGKGSVCSFTESILRGAGYKTGLYTSPHLVEPTERIKIRGKNISKQRFAKQVLFFKKLIEQKKIDASFFEIMTAMAFKEFYEKKTEIAIIETGMGGRLDATNIITPIASVITSISMEHSAVLGNTIEKIAKEKAGIIKQGKMAVTSEDNKGIKAIKKIAKEKKCELSIPKYLTKKASRKEQEFDLLSPKKISKLKSRLVGKYQAENASLAVTAVLCLEKKGFKISENAIRKGLKNAVWGGRLDVVSKKPLVVIDSAHNEDGWKKLEQSISVFGKKPIIVFAAMQDKKIKTAKPLLKKAKEVIITKPDYYRAADPKQIRKTIGFGLVEENPQKAFRKAIELAGKNGFVLVAGSIYLAGEIYKKLGIKP